MNQRGSYAPIGSSARSRRSKSLADLREMVAESRVPREIDDAVRRFDHVSAPQRPIAIENSSRRKMQRRHAVNGRPASGSDSPQSSS